MGTNKLWCEKYRPSSINDYIFHTSNHKLAFSKMIAEKSIPHLLLSGVQGSGKAQPLTAKVLTRRGWKFMGDISEGDIVITPKNTEAVVEGVFPQGEKDIYTITFHDGSSTECCLDHLWECYLDENNGQPPTKHIVDTRTLLLKLNNRKPNLDISIPLTSPIQASNWVEVPIPPYLLGVLLSSVTSNTIKITSTNEELISACEEELIEGYSLTQVPNTLTEYLLSDGNSPDSNIYISKLRELNIFGTRSDATFIPNLYKTLSVEERLELVRGMMDISGTVSNVDNSCSYTTLSHTLAKDLQQIFWSLGSTCTITSICGTPACYNETLQGTLMFTLHINHNDPTSMFFKTSHKSEPVVDNFTDCDNNENILRRRIVSIEYKSREKAQCIKIDDQDHLYITDDYIVTHNTTLARILINKMDVDQNDVMIINASDENNVDTVRDKIKNFITTFALGPFKIVNLEEADYMTPNGQAVLRTMMEEFSDVARFILTCNYENKVIPAIRSRCQHYRFKASDKDDIAEYVAKILISEKVKFKLEQLDSFIAVGYPDIRKIVQLLQMHTIEGVLEDPHSEGEAGDYKFEFLEMIETGQWGNIRKLICTTIVAEEWEGVYKFLYENLHKCPMLSTATWEEGILIIAEHLYKHGIVADPAINAAAMFIRLGQLTQQ